MPLAIGNTQESLKVLYAPVNGADSLSRETARHLSMVEQMKKMLIMNKGRIDILFKPHKP